MSGMARLPGFPGLVVFLLLGCSADIPEGTLICRTAEDCPSGWFCADGFCWSTQTDTDGGGTEGDNGRDGGAENGGAGGKAGTNGSAGTGGTDGSAETGGEGGASGESGNGDTGGSGGTGGETGTGGGGGTAGTCANVSVAVNRGPTNVVLVVDRSSSMILNQFGAENRWDALYNALMGNPDGLVFSLQSSIRFGFASYTNYPTEATPCPDIVTVFPPVFDNYNAISATYGLSSVGTIPISAVLTPVGETPTGESLAVVLDQLLPWVTQGNSPDAEPLGPTVLLLATDGEPDSCADISQDTEGRNDPARQMTVDQVNRAFQAGVQTYVLSVGSDVGDQHLQDVANAGVGSSSAGTSAPFWKADDPQGLQDALAAILGEVVSCAVKLNGQITDEQKACQEGTVALNGSTLLCGDPNGWQILDATYIELLGTACDRLKLSTSSTLEIEFPCDSVVAN
jgi:hypothetical protein